MIIQSRPALRVADRYPPAGRLAAGNPVARSDIIQFKMIDASGVPRAETRVLMRECPPENERMSMSRSLLPVKIKSELDLADDG